MSTKFQTNYLIFQESTRPHSAVSNVSDCRFRSREFDPSTVHTFAEIDHGIISIIVTAAAAAATDDDDDDS